MGLRLFVVWTLLILISGFVLGGTADWYIYHQPRTAENKNANDNSYTASKEDGAKAKSVFIPTDSIGLYTLVLAVFTGLLVVVSGIQIGFLYRADKTARISADAANVSAKVAATSNYPLVALVIHDLRIEYILTKTDGSKVTAYWYDPEVKFFFRNYGRTPAVITKISSEFAESQKAPTLPADPIQFDLGITRVIEQSENTFKISTQPITLTREQQKLLELGFTYLWLYGRVEFEDMFGNEFVHDFFWRYDGPQSVFGPYDEDRKRNRTYPKQKRG